ncbi:type I-E CRISPR-associated protein Cas6/Cse3/CasE [Actinomadura hibisca]|uniref:type I-E CRISPR-associated protein Cas6/Cse3/CasE n=1 Tax=Actinomadura hibisca TaxID=68565 RepID=UPI00083785A4|nr:type I-E CRISPR-associated protein Cas6/Cse3/CasE [Actinomadura hibisca]
MSTELFITHIALDLGHRGVLNDLRDIGKLHQRIMKLFPNGLGAQPRQQAAVLFRLDELASGTAVLIQSALKPDLDKLPTGYGVPRCRSLAPLLDSLRAGAPVHYRIIGNATSKLGKNTTAGRPKQVVPLQGADADRWWQRQAESAGLLVNTLISSQLSSVSSQRGPGRMTHARTRFDGTATVTDPAALVERMKAGIGRGKPYGCGLLTIAPVA